MFGPRGTMNPMFTESGNGLPSFELQRTQYVESHRPALFVPLMRRRCFRRMSRLQLKDASELLLCNRVSYFRIEHIMKGR